MKVSCGDNLLGFPNLEFYAEYPEDILAINIGIYNTHEFLDYAIEYSGRSATWKQFYDMAILFDEKLFAIYVDPIMHGDIYDMVNPTLSQILDKLQLNARSVYENSGKIVFNCAYDIALEVIDSINPLKKS